MKSKNTLEILKEAEAWLRQGKHRWCQGTYFKNKHDFSSKTTSIASTCAIGALLLVEDSQLRCLNAAKLLLVDALPDMSLGDILAECLAIDKDSHKIPRVIRFNDEKHRTYEDILKLYRKAIQLCIERAI